MNICGFRKNPLTLQAKAAFRLCRLCRLHAMTQEESPGSIGCSTSENRSCWRQQVRAEENDRHAVWLKRQGQGKGEKVA